MSYVYKAIKKSFKSNNNKVIGGIIFVASFLLSLWINNIYSLIGYFSLHTSFLHKIIYLVNYTASSILELSLFTIVYSSFLFILLSINTVLFIHIYKTARHLFGKAQIVTTSGVGFLVSLIGIGCFSCGAFILSYILSVFGLSSILLFLPFKGFEIVLLGVVILCISISILSKKLILLGK